jgi:hypothetical protein
LVASEGKPKHSFGVDLARRDEKFGEFPHLEKRQSNQSEAESSAKTDPHDSVGVDLRGKDFDDVHEEQ